APPSTPLLLGWIPFWFSLVLFAIPVVRWFRRPREHQRVDRENGRRGLLWALLNRLTKRGISEDTLKSAWKSAAVKKPNERELTREVVKLGGDLQLDDSGGALYRFEDLEKEIEAVAQERKTASEKEKAPGEIIFSSAD